MPSVLLKTRFAKSFVFFLPLLLFIPVRFHECMQEQRATEWKPTLIAALAPALKKNMSGSIDTNQLKQSGWYGRIMNDIEQSEYKISWDKQKNHYQAPNRAHNLRSYFDGSRLLMQPRDNKEDWKLELQVKGIIGDGRELYTPGLQPLVQNEGNGVTFVHNGQFSVQYINSKEGVRQNFIIEKAPVSKVTQIKVRMAVNKGWHIGQVHLGELHFAKRNKKRLDRKVTYNSLKAWDASNKELAARFILNDNHEIVIAVDAANAVYPVTIDPLSTTGEWTMQVNQADCSFGASVASAGDVNGDGYDDVIIGAPGYDLLGSNHGRVFVYHGSPTGLSGTINWSEEADIAEVRLGATVAGVGDVNNDGYDDVMMGAPSYSNGQAQEGRVYIYFGSSSGLSDLGADWREGNKEGAAFGVSIAGAGDVNGDGFDDVIIGAWQYSVNGTNREGKAFVYHGSSTGLPVLPSWTAEGDQNASEMGYCVAAAGDINHDGFDDVVVGAPRYDAGQTNEGKIFVYYGSGGGLHITADWSREGNAVDGNFGLSLCAGDINGDGFDDVIASYGSTFISDQPNGNVRFYYGSASGINGTGGNISGPTNSLFGFTVAIAGDVNSDGFDDVVISAPMYNNGSFMEGGAFLYYGSPTGPFSLPAWHYETDQDQASLSVATGAGDVNGDGFDDLVVGASKYTDVASRQGRVVAFYGSMSGVALPAAQVMEGNQTQCLFGWSLSGAGDVNGDGYGEIVVGAPYFDNGQADEGRIFVYQGTATGLNISAPWTAECDQAAANFGYSVSLAGDVNKDGYSDIIVGAVRHSNWEVNEGKVFVYHGSPGGLLTNAQWEKEINQADAGFGHCVATAGDVNGDGFSDVIIGALRYDNGETDEGRVYVYRGSSTGLTASPYWTGESNDAGALYGSSVGSAGDVNGDGFSDIIVGAPSSGTGNEGRAFVYPGSGSGIAGTAAWNQAGTMPNALFGSSVSSAGDVNGDGLSDFIVGARGYGNGQANEGAAFVYYGSTAALSGTAAWKTEGNQPGANLGVAVAGCDDMNGDGYGDIAVAADMYDKGQADEGIVLIFFGGKDGLTGAADLVTESNQAFSHFGYDIASAGDINGDGLADMIIGAYWYDNGQLNEGAAFVYYGSTRLLSTQSDPVSEGAADDEFGYALAGAGDINGDGYEDVVVAAPFFDTNDQGKIFLYYGGPGGLSATPVWSVNSALGNSVFGSSVATAGDVNGDGYSDIIVGALMATNAGQTGEGMVFVYHGFPSGLSADRTAQ